MRLAVWPVPMPKSILPGARTFRVAKEPAVTGGILLDGTRTPVPILMDVVLAAAKLIDMNMSALSICVSKNHALLNPNVSALFTVFQESTLAAIDIPKSIKSSRQLFRYRGISSGGIM